MEGRAIGSNPKELNARAHYSFDFGLESDTGNINNERSWKTLKSPVRASSQHISVVHVV